MKHFLARMGLNWRRARAQKRPEIDDDECGRFMVALPKVDDDDPRSHVVNFDESNRHNDTDGDTNSRGPFCSPTLQRLGNILKITPSTLCDVLFGGYDSRVTSLVILD
jgi:hypothetical protein